MQGAYLIHFLVLLSANRLAETEWVDLEPA